jgi:hypothetical protein
MRRMRVLMAIARFRVEHFGARVKLLGEKRDARYRDLAGSVL